MKTGSFPYERLIPFALAMGIIILVSNILVELPVQAVIGGFDLSLWVTYGAVTYPVAFLVTDLTNRIFGASAARKVVLVGFVFGVILSLILADIRIAVASGSAFLIAQLVDVFVFDRLRQKAWWQAPLISSLLGSALDTALFFSIAFAGTGLPWQTWALGDFAIKIAMASLLLPVFRALMAAFPSASQNKTTAVC